MTTRYLVTFFNPENWTTAAAEVTALSCGSAIMKARDLLDECFDWPVKSIEEL